MNKDTIQNLHDVINNEAASDNEKAIAMKILKRKELKNNAKHTIKNHKPIDDSISTIYDNKKYVCEILKYIGSDNSLNEISFMANLYEDNELVSRNIYIDVYLKYNDIGMSWKEHADHIKELPVQELLLRNKILETFKEKRTLLS